MNVKSVLSTMVLGGLIVTALPIFSQAQSTDRDISARKQATAHASSSATPSSHRTKHRYWRHRGGKHPHYGSRRIR